MLVVCGSGVLAAVVVGVPVRGGSVRVLSGWCGGVRGECCFWFPAQVLPVSPFVGVGGGVTGLLVENCIVDASILKRSNF